MRKKLKYVIKAWLMGYAVWNAYVVMRGVAIQYHDFQNGYVPREYFYAVWYIYVGAWISYVLLTISSFRCAATCIKWKSGKYVALSGVIGLFAYIIPIATFSVYSSRFAGVSIYVFPSIVVILIGMIIDFKKYDSLFARYIEKT